MKLCVGRRRTILKICEHCRSDGSVSCASIDRTSAADQVLQSVFSCCTFLEFDKFDALLICGHFGIN